MNSNHYNGTTKLGYQITEVLKLCSSTNAKKISELTKEACTALGLPLDTKGGGKPPAQNVAIFEWLRDNKTTTATESIDLPIVEPVAPAEEITQTIEPAEVLPVPEVTTNADLFALETVTPSNKIIINTDLITEINNQISLAESNADKALEFQDRAIAHSQNAGVLLLQVKATLRHGEFGGWLLENINVSERQAQRYMRSAKGLPVLRTITKTDTVSDLKNDADLIAQVETIETETLRLENEKLQNELLKAQQAAEELRNNQTQIIVANAVAEQMAIERAKMVEEFEREKELAELAKGINTDYAKLEYHRDELINELISMKAVNVGAYWNQLVELSKCKDSHAVLFSSEYADLLEYDEKSARVVTDIIHACHVATISIINEMRDRKGYAALGYESFKDYAQNEHPETDLEHLERYQQMPIYSEIVESIKAYKIESAEV